MCALLLLLLLSFLFKLRAWQSFCTTSFHVLFGLPLGLEPSTSYFIHFFTQSVSSFRSTWPYHHNLFCRSIYIISSIPSLSLNSLLETLSFTLTLQRKRTQKPISRFCIALKSFFNFPVLFSIVVLFVVRRGRSSWLVVGFLALRKNRCYCVFAPNYASVDRFSKSFHRQTW